MCDHEPDEPVQRHSTPPIVTIPARPKFAPTSVINIPPPVGPVTGVADEAVGAVYLKTIEVSAVVCPPILSETMLFVPWPAGKMQMACVCDHAPPTAAIGHGVEPIEMLPADAPKFVPLNVTAMFPAVVPVDGWIAVSEGRPYLYVEVTDCEPTVMRTAMLVPKPAGVEQIN